MKAEFNNGTYSKKCPYTKNTVGSVLCTGKKDENVKIHPCKHMIDFFEKETFIPVLDKSYSIVQDVSCRMESVSQLEFQF
ncbi:MAG: hypothetical protein HYR91_06190 [Flavobacteriia bacterium]|nr:hypothetical protein [Flavobacteriia bacterium]